MRFYLILFFCVSVLFMSCNDDKKIPDGVIQLHEMAALLTDIHIVDGSLYEVPQQMDTLSKHGLGMYMAVFKMHHVDTVTFNRSIAWYSTKPKLLSQIYVGVEQRMQKKIDSLQKHKPKENVKELRQVKFKHTADSVKSIKERAKIDSLQKVQIRDQIRKNKKSKFKKPHALPQ